MKSKEKITKKIFSSIIKEICNAPLYPILFTIGMVLFAFYKELYWIIFNSLIMVFTYFSLTLDSYRKFGITRGVLFLLGVSCIVVVFFYASIYATYGFKCDDTLYLYGLAPLNIARFWDSVYFSAVTFTTLGYGDCKPIAELRLICASEAVVGYMYLGMLVGCSMTYLTKKAKYQENQEEKKLTESIRKPRKFSKIYNRLFIPKELLERHKQELLEKQTQRRYRRFNVKTSKNKLKCK